MTTPQTLTDQIKFQSSKIIIYLNKNLDHQNRTHQPERELVNKCSLSESQFPNDQPQVLMMGQDHLSVQRNSANLSQNNDKEHLGDDVRLTENSATDQSQSQGSSQRGKAKVQLDTRSSGESTNLENRKQYRNIYSQQLGVSALSTNIIVQSQEMMANDLMDYEVNSQSTDQLRKHLSNPQEESYEEDYSLNSRSGTAKHKDLSQKCTHGDSFKQEDFSIDQLPAHQFSNNIHHKQNHSSQGSKEHSAEEHLTRSQLQALNHETSSNLLGIPISKREQRNRDLKARKKSTCSTTQATAEGKTKNGRWSMMEHVRFLEALKKYGKNWKMVEEHVATRTSTQARSHAQKFFLNITNQNMSMEEFLDKVSAESLNQLKKIAISKKAGGGYSGDVEMADADVLKLLMMHMSKGVHDDEMAHVDGTLLKEGSQHEHSEEPTSSNNQNPLQNSLTRSSTSVGHNRKKRQAKSKVNNLEEEVVAEFSTSPDQEVQVLPNNNILIEELDTKTNDQERIDHLMPQHKRIRTHESIETTNQIGVYHQLASLDMIHQDAFFANNSLIIGNSPLKLMSIQGTKQHQNQFNFTSALEPMVGGGFHDHVQHFQNVHLNSMHQQLGPNSELDEFMGRTSILSVGHTLHSSHHQIHNQSSQNHNQISAQLGVGLGLESSVQTPIHHVNLNTMPFGNLADENTPHRLKHHQFMHSDSFRHLQGQTDFQINNIHGSSSQLPVYRVRSRAGSNFEFNDCMGNEHNIDDIGLGSTTHKGNINNTYSTFKRFQQS